METLIHADIFFFVSTIAVVLIAIVSIIVGIVLVKTLRDIRGTIREVKEEASNIIGDVSELRKNVKSKITLISGFLSAVSSGKFIHSLLEGGKKKVKTKRKSKKE